MMREPAVLSHAKGGAGAPVVVLDISLRGLCFATSEVLESGSICYLWFCLPGSPTRHQTVVQIVHSSTAGVPSGFRVGAMFTEIAPESIEQIMDFVSKSAL